MKKAIILFLAICLVAGLSACTKKCKCSLWKNGGTVENAIDFERELDQAYDNCSGMSNFDETTQTGLKCK